MIVDHIKILLDKFSCNSIDDLYAAIGYGSIQIGKVFGKLRDEYIKTLSEEERLAMGYRTASDGQVVYYMPENLPDELGKGDVVSKPKSPEKEKSKKKSSDNGIVIDGMKNALVNIANCCHPLPGDEIVGYVTQSDGITIHKMSCPNIVHIKKCKDRSDKDKRRFERLIGATWDESRAGKSLEFTATIIIIATDCSKTRILADVSAVLSDEHVELQALRSPKEMSNGQLDLVITATFRSREQYDRVMSKINGLACVTSAFKR